MRYFLLCTIFLSSILSAETEVLAFAGSSRKGSFNQKLLDQAVAAAKKEGASVKVIYLSDYPMPFYHADLESQSGVPEEAKQFRKELLAHDRIIIASPEYNGFPTPLLLNAIDWASRDEQGKPSQAAFLGKRFAIISTSPGPYGGKRSLDLTKQLIENIGGITVKTVVALPNAQEAFSEKGQLKSSDLDRMLHQEINELLKP